MRTHVSDSVVVSRQSRSGFGQEGQLASASTAVAAAPTVSTTTTTTPAAPSQAHSAAAPAPMPFPALVSRAQALPFWKRALDLTLLALSTPVLLPLCSILAVYIKLVSPGKLFFKQQRVGLGGETFMMFKFRSMHEGSEVRTHESHLKTLMASDKPMQKLDHIDPRIIPLGRLIRACGIDELPQLINVLRGDMSLVGPRPCTVFEYEQYSKVQMERFNAVPGLTGLWQVSGKNRTTFEEMVNFDIIYSRRKSLMLDLRIIFLTVPALVVQVMDSRAKAKSAAATAPRHA